MKGLSIDLKNCYGIKSLSYNFDFIKSRVYSIYAPNGTMKTSFIKTFDDICSTPQRTPKDIINDVKGKIKINLDGNEINGNLDWIFPIRSMNTQFEPKEISTIIVNAKDKLKYDDLFKNILKQKDFLINKLNKASGIKKIDIENTILSDFSKSGNSFFDVMDEITEEIKITNDLKDIKYSDIFEDKSVLELLEKPEIVAEIEEYNKKYNEIIEGEKFKFFEKGKFTPYKAKVLLEEIKKQEFFVKENAVILSGVEIPIKDLKSLEDKISESFYEIESNPILNTIKEKISKRTKPIKAFHDIIESNGSKLIPEIKNGLPELKKLLWKSYFIENKEAIQEVLDLYKKNFSEMKEIQQSAKLEETKWKKVVKEFEERFFVPFKVDIEDAENVIIGAKEPTIVFKHYNDKTGLYDIVHKKSELLGLNILSGGEQRALYILYLLFEIKIKQEKGGEHLLIIDDIADSFDYKNKYAIIEYLQEISEQSDFYMIILTHNFDFYRSIQMRLDIKSGIHGDPVREGANLTVISDKGDINLHSGASFLNPIETLKNIYDTSDKALIALVPVARNLVDYIFGQDDQPDEDNAGNTITRNYYDDLTSVLHIKSKNITKGELLEIYNLVFSKNATDTDNVSPVKDIINNLCKDIIKTPPVEKLDIEDKIILSIGIRLKAEEFMKIKLGNIEKLGNQTRFFYNEYKHKLFFCIRNEGTVDEINEENIIKQVLLMTPESIHLNSFMYEPILDISNQHLIELYKKVDSLFL